MRRPRSFWNYLLRGPQRSVSPHNNLFLLFTKVNRVANISRVFEAHDLCKLLEASKYYEAFPQCSDFSEGR